ncbi:SCO family protein [Scleromatobacter humisilvae]|uniref:SCO family protein n=1 Tax=Scleromatobacter humisilvae TaxID=2897159 RepID=A0A9X1YK28_9BURK|nr:SCO family protein [Scleromatobacter humisilvae]MCK9686278.1 SCO family protein [Scleromatobacter humisilvae]
MKACVVLALVLAHAGAFAQALAPARDGPLAPTPAAPAVGFTQHLDAQLPLAVPFTDSAGHAVSLADEFPPDAGATLLMLGYHRCPQLCGLATQGVLEALRQSGLPAAAARVLFVSIDPAESAADAADKRRADIGYARLLAGAPPVEPAAIERLVGPPASIAALAGRVGFVSQPGDAAARFAHPAGVVVVTPDGRVSRYLMGVRFDPAELRAAIEEARAGQVGSLSDRLALLCAHLDPRTGAHSEAVLVGMRVTGLATLVLLAAFVGRRRRTR